MSELTDQLLEKIKEAKRKKIQIWPCNSNRASEIGHPCIRYLVYKRTHGDQQLLYDETLQAIFDDGHIHEERVAQDFKDAGYQIIEQQRSFDWKEYQITGHLDFKVVLNGTNGGPPEKAISVPVECKSMSPFVYAKLNTIEDFFEHKYAHVKKIPGQILTYLLCDNKDQGVLALKPKSSMGGYPLKLIQINLWEHTDYAESLLKKAETINEHVAKKALPDRIDYDENVCDSCAFRHICLTGALHKEPEIENDNSELIKLLEEREQLKDAHKRYEKVHGDVKKLCKDRPKILAGDFLIEGGQVHRDGYSVPASDYWKIKKIVRLK
jgi:hypothetical protein